MRRVVLQFYVSLDGYSCDAENGLRDVMMSIDDPEQEEHFVNRLRQAGTHIMGRNTYEGMAQFWPGAEHPSADPMNDIPKVVFSRTLTTADDWPVTRIAGGDTAEEIAKLKAEPGGEILAHGGTTFVRSLIELDLVDEYRLWVLPAAAGTGAALFTDRGRPLNLRLLQSTAFPSGVLELVYAPAGRSVEQAS
ncbi:dihydrofolate reductase family protein [Micromonospora chersina]|uniref:dihydrofolate reductase family protein n=1 Tax=Micromonospora chersina TaxID=47854 RepID=UPI003405D7E1